MSEPLFKLYFNYYNDLYCYHAMILFCRITLLCLSSQSRKPTQTDGFRSLVSAFITNMVTDMICTVSPNINCLFKRKKIPYPIYDLNKRNKKYLYISFSIKYECCKINYIFMYDLIILKESRKNILTM